MLATPIDTSIYSCQPSCAICHSIHISRDYTTLIETRSKLINRYAVKTHLPRRGLNCTRSSFVYRDAVTTQRGLDSFTAVSILRGLDLFSPAFEMIRKTIIILMACGFANIKLYSQVFPHGNVLPFPKFHRIIIICGEPNSPLAKPRATASTQ